MNIPQPAVALARRQLHFIWLIDCSGSMTVNGKIQAVNSAINETLPEMLKVAAANPEVQVMVRAVTFASGAQWHVSQSTLLEDFRWQPVSASGVTDMGRAFRLVADYLGTVSGRNLPPVLVLMSDGAATDDVSGGLQALLNEPWGKKAVRLSVAIGDDADLDMLQKFMSYPEMPPLRAGNPEQLVQQIKWASTAALGASSKLSHNSGNPQMPPLPMPPPPDPGNAGSWVF